jgi:hypothetical protein
VDDVYAVAENQNIDESVDFIPMSFALATKVQGTSFNRPLLVLFDPGSTSTWLKASTLPRGIQGETKDSITGQTLAGNFTSNQVVRVQDLSFPEFDRSKRFQNATARLIFNRMSL